MNNTLYQLLKNDIRASLVLARNYRMTGERRTAIQFVNDAASTRKELLEVIADAVT